MNRPVDMPRVEQHTIVPDQQHLRLALEPNEHHDQGYDVAARVDVRTAITPGVVHTAEVGVQTEAPPPGVLERAEAGGVLAQHNNGQGGSAVACVAPMNPRVEEVEEARVHTDHPCDIVGAWENGSVLSAGAFGVVRKCLMDGDIVAIKAPTDKASAVDAMAIECARLKYFSTHLITRISLST